MLSGIIHVGFEVPLRSHIVRALFGSLIVGLQQKVSDLLQIHLVKSIIDTVPIHTSVKIIRICPYVIWVVSYKIRIISSEIRIIVNINSVVTIPGVWS